MHIPALASVLLRRRSNIWKSIIGTGLSRRLSVRPHIALVAFGAREQDLWMSRYAAALAPALILGVGAALDFLAPGRSGARRS
jgi:hypothetical protein